MVNCPPEEPAPSPSIPVGHLIDPDSEVRGVWIASVWNLDYPSRTDLSAAELEAEADAILNDCAACGINTLFFQVRPAADALYDSDLFPVSSALSSISRRADSAFPKESSRSPASKTRISLRSLS